MRNKHGLSKVLAIFMALALFSVTIWVALVNTQNTLAENTGIAEAATQMQVERAAPAHLEEVPAEIQELFAEGLTVEEFVQMVGHVPPALEGLVEGDALMIIEMEGDPLAVYYANQQEAGQTLAANAMESYIQNLEAAQNRLQADLDRLDVQVISNYTIVYNGMQVLTPLSQLNEIRALPGVKAVHRAPIHEPAIGASVPLIGAPDVWNDFGYDGDGVVIAIIDTGIDYTHAAFGGSGDPADYDDNDPDIIEPGSFPTAKVIAGYDFAGTTYNADSGSPAYQPIPNPDPDPLDQNGHGTHVASTAAGIAAGDVMTGTAPGAELMALKVFGVTGSTALVIDALEMATYNYLLYGWPQVINMSLGAPFGTNDPSNPSVLGSENAALAGITVIASAGNAGNNHYITSLPAAADRAISVAASTTGYYTGPTIHISGTAYITQTNIAFTQASFGGGTGPYTETTSAPLGYVGDLDGATNNELCSTAAITPTNALDGQIALIQRGTCAFSIKINNAADLGAVGAIIYNNAPGLINIGAPDPVDIPAAFIQMHDGENLIPADSQIVVVSPDDLTTVDVLGVLADEIGTFSSRGPRGYDSALKPEIAAPGVGIFAANMGSGTGGVGISGTSMAAPHVAGVAALMLQANPDASPEQVKARMMNTAVPLIDDTPIPRMGAGRVNAYRSVDTDFYAVGHDDLVSLSWGVIMSSDDNVTRTDTVTIYNESASAEVFTATVGFQTGSWTAGAMVSVEPMTVTVPAGGSAEVTVTLSLDMTQIPVLYGPTGLEEYYGFVNFTPPGGDPTDSLVVPFYFQPRPYAELTEITGSGVISEVNDIATFALTHTGPISSSLWVYPALVSNSTPNPAMAGPGETRMFGLDFGWTHATHGDIVVAAIDSWGPWHVPQPHFFSFDLYIDANQDGVADYVNFNYNLGLAQGAGNNNTWVVLQVDLATGGVALGSPFLIYTDYNNSFMEWYLPAAWQDLGPGNSTFDYQLIGSDAGGVRVSPVGSFDYVRYPFNWMITNNPGPAMSNAELWVSINSVPGYRYSQPLGVMVVDYNGDPRNQDGAQAYLVPIQLGPSPFILYLPVVAND
jgi:minor extracellular serine protease Vpr